MTKWELLPCAACEWEDLLWKVCNLQTDLTDLRGDIHSRLESLEGQLQELVGEMDNFTPAHKKEEDDIEIS